MKICILVFVGIFVVETFSIIYLGYAIQNVESNLKVNITNTSCTKSENIGRRIFLHVCVKEGVTIYDIRYFFTQESEYVKPEKIGVQLTEKEFLKICKHCEEK